MAAQRKNLMQTLAVVAKSIDKLDTIVPAVQALGARHAGYGVTPEMFGTVGQALIDTLAVGSATRSRRVPERLGRRLHDPVDRDDRRDGGRRTAAACRAPVDLLRGIPGTASRGRLQFGR